MTVYVDPIFLAVPRTAQARRHGEAWCHLTADTPEELHAFAARLGMKRLWAQREERGYGLHYDIIPSKRALAVRLGRRSRPPWRLPIGSWPMPAPGARGRPSCHRLSRTACSPGKCPRQRRAQ